MLFKIYSAALFDLETALIEVKIDVFNGLHSFNIIGLLDISIKKLSTNILCQLDLITEF